MSHEKVTLEISDGTWKFSFEIDLLKKMSLKLVRRIVSILGSTLSVMKQRGKKVTLTARRPGPKWCVALR